MGWIMSGENVMSNVKEADIVLLIKFQKHIIGKKIWKFKLLKLIQDNLLSTYPALWSMIWDWKKIKTKKVNIESFTMTILS